jgi:hypothetical protein
MGLEKESPEEVRQPQKKSKKIKNIQVGIG